MEKYTKLKEVIKLIESNFETTNISVCLGEDDELNLQVETKLIPEKANELFSKINKKINEWYFMSEDEVFLTLKFKK